jgi:hypothetical protein
MKFSWVVLGAAAAAIWACGAGVTDGSGRRSRIVLDLGRGLAAQQAGDFVSVLDSARLTITSGGGQQTVSGSFGQGESATTLDVSVESGPVTFGLDVVSNNKTVVYRADTTTTIDADGFSVTIVPRSVNAMMVVLPRRPTFTLFDTGNSRFFRAVLEVRNPGSTTLTWRVDSLPPPGTLAVQCTALDVNCLQPIAWAPGLVSTVSVVYVVSPTTTSPPAQGIRFISSVGTAVTTP